MSKNKKLNFQGLGLDIDDDLNRITNCDHHKANANNMRVSSRQYHALPDNDQIQALVAPDTMHLVLPSACISNMDTHHDATDMTGKMTPEGRRILVRNCVKNVLFRRLKFFKKDLHGMYDQRTTSVCGLVIKSCNLPIKDATLEWWATMRKVVIATHTDHRNNVIKTMRLRFRGTCWYQYKPACRLL
jgi:hypothetical protein